MTTIKDYTSEDKIDYKGFKIEESGDDEEDVNFYFKQYEWMFVGVYDLEEGESETLEEAFEKIEEIIEEQLEESKLYLSCSCHGKGCNRCLT